MEKYNIHDFRDLEYLFIGKSEVTLTLFHHFVNELKKVGPVTLHPAKTMIGIANANKRIMYITQHGRKFYSCGIPIQKSAYPDNSMFSKNCPGTRRHTVQSPFQDRLVKKT